MRPVSIAIDKLGCSLRAQRAHIRPFVRRYPGFTRMDHARMMSSGPPRGIHKILDREEYRQAIPPEWSHLPLRLRWLKPTFFFVSSSLGIFALSACLTNRDTDICLENPMDSGVFYAEGNETLRVMRSSEHHQSWLGAVEEASSRVPDYPRIVAALRHPILYLQANVQPETITLALLMPLSVAWIFPRLRTALFRHWSYSFRSRKAYTMLTAIFSHQLPFQWVSLFAAWAAMPITATWFRHTADSIQHESSPWYHMTAFCLSAGMFSFLAPQFIFYLRFRSAFQKLARGIPGPYTNMKINKALSYSLGVTGTVHACLTLSICSNPHAPASVLTPDVSRGTVWGVICAIESVCMYLCLGHVGWTSNLCGVAFGSLYNIIGPSFWTSMRMFMHRIQFPSAWELNPETLDSHPYPGKYITDPHPLFKRYFGEAMGWNY